MTGSLSHTRGRPEPGRELDALIAEKVMGWTDIRIEGSGRLRGRPAQWENRGNPFKLVPRYSTDIAAAFTVVATMRALGLMVWLDSDVGPNREWRAGFDRHDWTTAGRADAPTAPHAICLAALAALSPAAAGGRDA